MFSTLAAGPVIIVTTAAAADARPERARRSGAAGRDGPCSRRAGPGRGACASCPARGIQSLLLEGGTVLHAAAWDAGVVDYVQLYVAPIALGAGGVPLAHGAAFSTDALFERRVDVARTGRHRSKDMFTGLIEARRRRRGVEDDRRRACGFASHTPLASELAPGDSLAVNGVCLTVTDGRRRRRSTPTSGRRRLRVTTLGSLRPAIRPSTSSARCGPTAASAATSSRDTSTAPARSSDLRDGASAHWLTDRLPAGAGAAVRPQGVGGGRRHQPDGRRSAATIAFDVMIIPFTWAHTNLSSLRVGDTRQPGMRHGGEVRGQGACRLVRAQAPGVTA